MNDQISNKMLEQQISKIKNEIGKYHAAVYAFCRATLMEAYYLSNNEDDEKIYIDSIKDALNAFKTVVTNAIERSRKCIETNKSFHISRIKKWTLSTVDVGVRVGDILISAKSRNNYIANRFGGGFFTPLRLKQQYVDEVKEKNDSVNSYIKECNDYYIESDKLETSILTIEMFFESKNKPAEIVACNDNYYIKYIDKLEIVTENND